MFSLRRIEGSCPYVSSVQAGLYFPACTEPHGFYPVVGLISPQKGSLGPQNQRTGPYLLKRKVRSRLSKTIPRVRAPKFRLRPTPQPRRGQTNTQTNTQTNKHTRDQKPSPLRHLAPRTPALAHKENDRPFATPSLGYIYIYIYMCILVCARGKATDYFCRA